MPTHDYSDFIARFQSLEGATALLQTQAAALQAEQDALKAKNVEQDARLTSLETSAPVPPPPPPPDPVPPPPDPAPVPPPAPTVQTVFATSFDGPEWNQSSGTDPDPSPLISRSGDWGASFNGGTGDQITLAANRAGSLGNGFRHYRGTGSNSNGGGIRCKLPAALSEMWVRLYMRNVGLIYSGGAPGYTKDMYWNQGGNFLIFGYQGGAWGLHTVTGSVNIPSTVKYADTADRWNLFEYHARLNSGLVEMKINGVLVLQRAINLGSTPWVDFILGENQSSVTTAGYTDYDDVAVSATDWIGA